MPADARPASKVRTLTWDRIQERRAICDQRNIRGEIVAWTKGEGPPRAPEIPEPVAADLAAWRLASGNPSAGLVFPRAQDGRPWTKVDWDNWRGRRFRRARKAAELPEGFRPYDLRHTCASLMVAAGRPLPEIAAQLGHSVATSVRDYQHLIEAMRGRPVQPIETLIRAARVRPEYGHDVHPMRAVGDDGG